MGNLWPLLLIPFRMILSNVLWPITRILLGSVCMLDGGCVPLSNVRMELSWSGRRGPRKVVS
jgi:hypothetical protein